ncbi:MAG: serine protease [Proteobacteria bacterium]|nr:MAG: serine protease [Pseudomonadota bacterium]
MAESAVKLDENAHRALLGLKASVPDDAMTAELLGTEREGHAVRIRADGLALTVGYLVTEADAVWLTNSDGESAPANVIALDHQSGLALVRPDLRIGEAHLAPRRIEDMEPGASVRILNSVGGFALSASLAAVGEFAGRWEYVVDRALYTIPACDDWGGAALLDTDGALLGIGSLLLELPTQGGSSVYGNMFVPTELIMPHVDDLCLYGIRRTPPIPWLGWMVQEHEDGFAVVGIYPDGPAERAGVQLGDAVIEVAGRQFDTLGTLFRTVQSVGSAGAHVPVTVKRESTAIEVDIVSVDRNAFFQKQPAGPVN